MRTSLVLSLLSAGLIAAGVVNAQAANAPFYNPSNIGAGVWTPETIHAPNAVQIPSTTSHEINRTIGCPGKQILDKGCAIEDADKDTVEDWTDLCPNTPAGMKVNAVGCEIDTDGDGVMDSVDKCPTVYAQTPDGCPPVVVKETVVTPAPAPAPAPGAPFVVLGDVNFDFDKATLKPSADEKIDKAVAHINEMSGDQFEVKGYTDSIGSEAYNLKLSQRRAEAVRDALIKKGAPADRITAKGYGEASPVATNSTKEGRAQNRRVELWGPKIERAAQ
jgi:outer membrane protein OmpA-like peptidoglycan-associated protein